MNSQKITAKILQMESILLELKKELNIKISTTEDEIIDPVFKMYFDKRINKPDFKNNWLRKTDEYEKYKIIAGNNCISAYSFKINLIMICKNKNLFIKFSKRPFLINEKRNVLDFFIIFE